MRINTKALAVGYLINLTGSISRSLFNLVVNFFYFSYEQHPYIRVALSYSLLFISFLFTILAGYIGAKIAKKNEALHGICLGIVIWIIASVSNYFIYARFSQDEPILSIRLLTSLLLTVGPCLLGAFVRKRINDKSKETLTPLEEKIENLGNN